MPALVAGISVRRVGIGNMIGMARTGPAMTAERIVTDVLTIVTDIDTYPSESRPVRTRPGRHAPLARASADPAGGLATRSRAALGINPPALGPECEVRRWTGTGRGG